MYHFRFPMIPTRSTVVWICLAASASVGLAQGPEFVSAQPLPEVVIDGESVPIHTQGLYVTEHDYFVTGRVDKLPRRPVLMRFPRDNPNQYEVLDLSQTTGLDHPGGFDRDQDGLFWIPVSTSHRVGPTKVMGVSLSDRKLPTSVSQITKSFEVPDHLGAICCLNGAQLLAANWDTQTIYLIDSGTGEVKQKFAQQEFFEYSQPIRLAVQDWKFDLRSKRIVAGGIDKFPINKSNPSVATIAWIDPLRPLVVATIRLDSRDDVTRPLTNEGLALYGRDLFLLPEDIGRGAKVLRFCWQDCKSDDPIVHDSPEP